jgi:hypothetical protein
MALLHLYRNGKRIQTVEMGDRTYIVGREKVCDLVLDEESASRQHFRLVPKDDVFELEDLGSSNGTFVDGVREYRAALPDQAMIQVGKSLMMFEARDVRSAPDEILELPEWAVTTDEMDIVDPADEEPSTRPVAPAVLRQVQAETLARTRPHLVQQRAGTNRVIPLDAEITTIGYGPTRISLGPTKKATPKVLAEISQDRKGRFRIEALGLFGKIDVNGKARSAGALEPGDVFVIDGQRFTFHRGLEDVSS